MPVLRIYEVNVRCRPGQLSTMAEMCLIHFQLYPSRFRGTYMEGQEDKDGNGDGDAPGACHLLNILS